MDCEEIQRGSENNSARQLVAVREWSPPGESGDQWRDAVVLPPAPESSRLLMLKVRA